jgi:hypothetical protein
MALDDRSPIGRAFAMRRASLSLAFVFGAFLVQAALGACSAGTDDESAGAGGTGPGAGPGPNGSGGGFGSGGEGSGAVGCSADLQQTVDANGNVVATCPPDLGCYGGQCIPACEAAASSKGSIGCEYFAPTPPFYVNEAGSQQTYDGPCHAVFVANTWGRSAKLTVQHNGVALDATQFTYIPSGVGPSTMYAPVPADGIPPGDVAVVFLAHRPGVMHGLGFSLECPRPPAVLMDTAVQGSGSGPAFDVVSDTPITAYDIVPYGGATSFLPSASLLFPRTAWGTNYTVLAPHVDGGGGMWMFLVGTADGTTVDVLSPVTLLGGGGVPTVPAGTTTPITVNRGQIVQFMGADPTAAILQSSLPVGVWTGNTYLRVSSATSFGGGQDSAHQQIPHIGALGNEYVGASIMTRMPDLSAEDVPYRLLGVVDGTMLTYDPAPPPGAPVSLNAGQVAEFSTMSLFSVRSQDEQHPFAFSQYMPGTFTTRPGCAATPPFSGLMCGLGDEEWVIQLPPKQFLQRYAFFTDPTYAATNIVVTRVAGPSGFADVNVACFGNVSGWQPVGTGGTYEVAFVDLYRSFSGTAPACATSQHEATSSGAFGITVWGTDYYASYGYPAGGNIGTINDVVVPPVPR